MKKDIYIAVDFDGTIVHHKYPEIGRAVPNAFKWLNIFQKHGVKLILWTMRSGETLTDAYEFCKANGVEFYSTNGNPDQWNWTNSPKAYAHIYIDDAAIGCPLIEFNNNDRPIVDWNVVGPAVLSKLGINQDVE